MFWFLCPLSPLGIPPDDWLTSSYGETNLEPRPQRVSKVSRQIRGPSRESPSLILEQVKCSILEIYRSQGLTTKPIKVEFENFNYS